MTGEQHERAVEAMAEALRDETVAPGEQAWGMLNEATRGGYRRLARAVLDAYHRSLAEQGVRLVDLAEVAECLRDGGDPSAAEYVERRFGGAGRRG